MPLARDLAASGYAVTGVDLSVVQIQRARQLVPTARFLHADATQIGFPPSSFDAVVSLYALIHMPLEEQPSLLGRIGRWLRPGGWLLATTGQCAWTGTEDHWLGGEAPMWWSHADAATYRDWIEQAGLSVLAQEVICEGDGAHALFLGASLIGTARLAAGGLQRGGAGVGGDRDADRIAEPGRGRPLEPCVAVGRSDGISEAVRR